MGARAIASMTGFARVDGQMAAPIALTWAWEARSVNSKSLDVRLRVPHGFDALDAPLRKLVAEHVSRGSVSINLSIVGELQSQGVKINEEILNRLIKLAADKAQTLPAGIGPASLDGLMAIRGVIEPIEPQVDSVALAERDKLLIDSFRAALKALVKARDEEGGRLLVVMDQHLARLTDLVAMAGASSAAQPAAIKARFERQIADMTSGTPAPTPERLAQEVAMLAVKADIREEIDRLKAHLGQAADMLKAGGPCGRRLDFLSQEFNREANTLCSKSQDVELTRIGLDLKATIDQLREQIQNIE
jgi:uncharacterized protein (TIGR00255 family)